MSYLVTLTFDLRREGAASYGALDQALSGLGFSRTITGKSGKSHELPANVYVGEFEGETVGNIRDDLASRVNSAFQRLGIKGTIFISVGGNWAWGMRYP